MTLKKESGKFIFGFVLGFLFALLLLFSIRKYNEYRHSFNVQNQNLNTATGSQRKSTTTDDAGCTQLSTVADIQKHADGTVTFKKDFGYPFYKDTVSGIIDPEIENEQCVVDSDVPAITYRGHGFKLIISPLHFNPEIPYYTAKYVGKMYRIGMLFRIQTLYDGQQRSGQDQFTYYYSGLYLEESNQTCRFKDGPVRSPCGENYLSFDEKDQDKSIYIAKCQADTEVLATKCDKIMLSLIIDRK